ncbi:hypothetical protein KUCAC02_036372, partial [Chaenocephalus aceratus]
PHVRTGKVAETLGGEVGEKTQQRNMQKHTGSNTRRTPPPDKLPPNKERRVYLRQAYGGDLGGSEVIVEEIPDIRVPQIYEACRLCMSTARLCRNKEIWALCGQLLHTARGGGSVRSG